MRGRSGVTDAHRVVPERMPPPLGAEVDRERGHVSGEGLPDQGEPAFGDAARGHEVAVGVGEPLPRADGGEVGRSQRRRLVLGDGQVRDPQHPHPTVRPRLRPGPLDQVVDVTGLVIREERSHAPGGPGPAGVGVDHDVATFDPRHRVRRLPARLARDPEGLGLVHDPELEAEQPAPVRPPGEGVLAVGVRRRGAPGTGPRPPAGRRWRAA